MKIRTLYLAMILALLLASACKFNTPFNPATIAAVPTQATGRSTPQAAIISFPSDFSAETCINDTLDNPQCKDCCDCLPGADATAVKSCRDACAGHDFSQNSASFVFTAPSELGPEGDYSLFTAAGNQPECKRLCDSSTTLACGDRRFCRDACANLADTNPMDGGSPPVEKTPHPSQSVEDSPPSKLTGDGGAPPPEAIASCNGKREQDICEFVWQKGTEIGVCETVQNQLACSPKHAPDDRKQPGKDGDRPSGGNSGGGYPVYNIEQALSDKAQGMTIAFDALAFLTGDLGADSFFPPGKVADFWGFQYLRDNDPSQMGHAGDFLTSAAMNMLNTLSEAQRAQLVALAKSQVASIQEYAYRRFVLMQAFRRLATGDLPAGTSGLNEEAIKAYSAELYGLDGQISFARAQLMGNLLTSMDATQLAYLDKMVGKGMLEWPKVEEPSDIRGLDRDVKVAVMTYAADMFSWYAGSVEADVYFCPERHGTYFGSFYLKDRPAMDNSGYAIPADLTGNMGDAMLATLTPDQAKLITGLVDIQKPYLQGIVDTRTQVSNELRKFKVGGNADKTTILSLMEHYGELDGEIIYNLAVNFAQVNQTLTSEQKAQLIALRQVMLGDLMYPSGAYLYSQPISMPKIPNTDFLFK